MGELTLTKVIHNKASDVTSLYELEDPVRSLQDDTASPAEFVSLLMRNQYYGDALQFMLYALPKREAVWLTCMIYSENSADNGDGSNEPEAIKRAKEWVFSPDEEHRLAAMELAESQHYQTPESFVSAAVAWSSGSLSGPDNPPVPPAEDLTAKALWASVVMHVYKSDPETITAKFHAFLDQAIDIANGGTGHMSQP
ncbi:hypothetical protein DI392_07895 [Vibrio albus]|uniref:Uncharacterized protein n=1 Tax=Vibrio albus TaxID=2200953 RepID=A0A2U3BBJ4_9VIBR|nr:hypothetical protein [Vibrio albus]PWI34105.1 hypothetical protein DI392_07895 [Vibrio albus]